MTTPLSRVAALLLLVLAAATVGGLLGAAVATYLVVVVGAVAALSAVVAVRLWCRRCFGSRLFAILLSAGILVGQVLGASVGGPAGEGSGWHPAAVGVVSLGLVVPLLLAVDARVAVVPDPERRPYAL